MAHSLQYSAPPSRRPGRWLAGLLAMLLALAGLVAFNQPAAEAQVASGGTGRFLGAVDWVVWGANGQNLPNTGFSGSSTRVIGGVTVTTTCTASALTSSQTNQATSFVRAYRSGNWRGDGLDDLYNIGGTGTQNQLVSGLANNTGSALVTFDVDCTATADGRDVPLAGLVVADAEQSQLAGSGQLAEYIAVTPSTPATWRIIDRYRDAACAQTTTALVNAQNTLRLSGPPASLLCASGPMAVAFMEGAQGANVQMQGGGTSSIALGVVLSTEFGDAPASAGEVAHLMSPTFSGGTLPVGQPVAVHNASFTLGSAQGSVWGLGVNADPEPNALPSADATGDDVTGGGAFGPPDDEDALATTAVTGVVGGPFSTQVPCRTQDGSVAAWIDWNLDGDFLDTGERSATATCESGDATLEWTIPATTVGQAFGAPALLRLRGANDPADIAEPTGLAYSGEVEDHQVALNVATTVEVVKVVDGRGAPGDDFTVAIRDGATTVASAATGIADTVTTQQRIVDTGVAYQVGETMTGSGFSEYLTPTIACTIDGVTTNVTGAAPTWTLPPLVDGQQARCVITNEAIDAGLELEKAADPVVDAAGDGPTVGDTIDYRFTVRNVGNAPLTGVAIDDPKVAVTCGQTTLAVGEVITCGPASYTLTQADIDAGAAVNTATVSGVGPDGDAASASDSLTTSLAPRPVPQNDQATTAAGTPVTVDVLRNDAPGTAAATIDPAATVFPAAGQPTGAVVTDGGRTLTVAGEGQYRIDPATGAITFTPEATFTGNATPITYTAGNTAGATADAQLRITVLEPAAANDDRASTPYGTPVDVDVLGNDQASGGATIDPTSVVFPTAGQPTGATVAMDGKTLTVPGEGVYTVDATTGSVRFTPAAGFTGAATPVPYSVTDSTGATVAASISIDVQPALTNDNASTPPGQPVTLDVLDNDTGAGLDPASVRLPSSGQPTDAIIAPDGRRLELPGVGVFTVGTDGSVTFTPASGFQGTTPAVAYEASSADGVAHTAQLTVSVAAPTRSASALPDNSRTLQGAPVTFDVLTNDTPSVGATWQESSAVLPGDNQPGGAGLAADGVTLAVPDQGTFAFEPDAQLTFTPDPTFVGTTAPITYEVTDSAGITVATTATVVVDPSPAVPPIVTQPDGTAPVGSAPPTTQRQGPHGVVRTPLTASTLPRTGGDVWPGLLLAAFLLAAGGVALAVMRRRQG